MFVIAGTISTLIFTASTFPMLQKAWKTKDLKSYSFPNLLLCNIGNAIHWLYVASLPVGPIWLLHGFATLSTLTMLIWYIMFTKKGEKCLP